MECGIKKIISTIIILCLPMTMLIGCGKPSDMDQKTYELCQEAITVGDNCISGKTSMSDANRKLEIIYSELDEYVPDNSTSHVLVASSVLNMTMQTSDFLGTSDSEALKESVAKLRDYCS
ncbi:MAG: hypothetical protein RR672_03540 [Raoultibacter sp.]